MIIASGCLVISAFGGGGGGGGGGKELSLWICCDDNYDLFIPCRILI